MTAQYRVAVAGCGGMANAWIEYALLRPDTKIVALVDIRLESAEAMAAKHGISCLTFTDIKQAIQETAANLVFDVTVPGSHFNISSTALELGCNVFSEKPLAETMEECNKIVEISERTGNAHAVMQNRRYDPRIRSLRKIIESGTIGRTGFIGASFFLGAHFGGFRDVMKSPLLLDMAIHTFDQARFINGANPVSVYCQEFNPPGSWYEGNASAVCIFEMSDGSIFTYQGSWCAEGASTSWEASWRVNGEKGTAIWDGHELPYAEVVTAGDQSDKFIRDVKRINGDNVEMNKTFHHGCLDEMFLSLAEQRPAETNCRDNRYSMAMVFGALESAESGRKIDLVEF
ncbi:Gfo/Idh/MocA family oxidoreductase [Paenibacillus odorifer]|uniref:Gfo/Idh/MocA family protein n=1 Tax=Paenibacillus TaxID=44249 RepID=UPI00096D4A23|nr:Gfo/Idh/MocA family oxidoreductase [Paenibacillus odorifer]OME27253.1 oxidoreductase [Paenibacillus odorifer]OME32775.1 oxidoreductase [Paenibacillus odorifer]OME37643.1 oxidoreductase [Paenibacillus odorifer]